MLEGFNFRIIFEYLPLFLAGLRTTFLISIASIFLALVVGTLACACRLSSWRLLRWPAIAYIELTRSTPLLVQIYFFYFGLPTLGIRIPEVQTGILALMLNSGAYIAEIVRAGISSVSSGHIEAGKSSGLTICSACVLSSCRRRWALPFRPCWGNRLYWSRIRRYYP
jgi:polar amino acid transport system permease protein